MIIYGKFQMRSKFIFFLDLILAQTGCMEINKKLTVSLTTPEMNMPASVYFEQGLF